MLALFAGQGALPRTVLHQLESKPIVFALSDFPPEGVEPDILFRIERLGSVIADLKARGATEICFAGAVSRPVVDPTQIDAATLPLVPILQKAMTSGDDGALRGILSVFEQAGLAIRGAHEIAPDLLPAPAIHAGHLVATLEADAQRGAEIVAAMGKADIGQACIVKQHQAIAVEGMFGTDWMLRSLKFRPDTGGGLLFKAPKPGQDRRIDMPTIGPDTVQAAVDAGLEAIVIEAGGVMVLDLPRVVQACRDAGLVFWVREGAI